MGTTNKVYEQLRANERSNFTDQGNNTYLDKSNVTRDAIGREIEVGSGYDLHSDITPADKSNNNVQADYTLNGVAQAAIVEEASFASTYPTYDENSNGLFVVGTEPKVATIDKTATIGLVTVPNLEGIESGTATDVAIKSMDDISAQLQADLAVQVEEENLYATATPLAQESLSDKARKDSTRLKEKENKEESIAAHAKYQNDRIENIANKSDNAAELNAERVIIDKTATIGLVTVPNDEGIESGIATDVAIKSMDDISSKLQADLKVQVEEENLYATATPLAQESLSDKAKIDSERLKEKEKKEESIFAHNKYQNDRIDNIANKSDKAAEKAADDARKKRQQKNTQERFAQSQDSEGTSESYLKSVAAEKAEAEAKTLALKEQNLQSAAEAKETERKLKDNAGTTPLGESADEEKERLQSKERLESNADTTPLGKNAGLQEESRRKLAKEKEEKRLHEEQINNATTNDVGSGYGTSYSNYKKQNRERNSYLAEQEAKRKADVAAEFVGSKMDKDNNLDPVHRLISNDPYSFSTLAYPSDLVGDNENGHYMLFYVNVQNYTKYEYNSAEGENIMVGDTYISEAGTEEVGIHQGASNINPIINKGANADEVSYQSQQHASGKRGNALYNNIAVLSKGRKILTGINSQFQTTTRITDSVALYLPPGIGNSTSADYGDSQTGMAGYLALSGVDMVKAVRDHDFVGAASTIFDSASTIFKEAFKKFSMGALDLVTGSEGSQQMFDKAFGQTLNPYLETTYNSMGMRNFSYTFQFAPKSRKETDEVKAIIQLFRFHMAPEMKAKNHRYLTLPSTFDIHYMFQSAMEGVAAQENSFYNKIATCVLTNVDVNYTPNEGVKSFGDGAPTQITMGLSFKETEMLTKQKINEGF